MYQQPRSSLPLCQILCHDVYFSLSMTLLYDKKTANFCQDVFNTHGFDCTCQNIRIFFLKIKFTLLGIDLEGMKDFY